MAEFFVSGFFTSIPGDALLAAAAELFGFEGGFFSFFPH